MSNKCRIKRYTEGFWLFKFHVISLKFPLYNRELYKLTDISLEYLSQILPVLSIPARKQGILHSIRGALEKPKSSNNSINSLAVLNGKINKNALELDDEEDSDQIPLNYTINTSFNSYDGLSILYDVKTDYKPDVPDVLDKFSLVDIIRNPCTKIEKINISFARYLFTSKLSKFAKLPLADTIFCLKLMSNHGEIILKTRSNIKQSDLKIYEEYFLSLGKSLHVSETLNNEFNKYLENMETT